MKTRPKTSACALYLKMIENPPTPRTEKSGGTLGVGTNGHAIFTPGNSHQSYDQATLELLRAKEACKAGMVIDVKKSKGSQLFYKHPDDAQPMPLDNIQTDEKDKPFARTWMPGFRPNN